MAHPLADGPAACRAPSLRPLPMSRTSSRETVLRAARQMLATRGLAALTFDSVARCVGVEARVISRWWPSEEALALDALRQEWLTLAARTHRRGVRSGVERI
jgi:AcrR family transcriptional regulator